MAESPAMSDPEKPLEASALPDGEDEDLGCMEALWPPLVDQLINITVWGSVAGLFVAMIYASYQGVQRGTPALGPLVILSILPSLVIIFVIYCKLNPTAVRLRFVVGVYLVGVLSSFPTMVIETAVQMLVVPKLSQSQIANKSAMVLVVIFCQAYIVAACCEELIKLGIGLWAQKFLTAKTHNKIVVITIVGALGFAGLENVSYVSSTLYGEQQQQSGPLNALVVAVVRAITAVPLHASCGALIGCKLARKLYFNEDLPYWRVLELPVLIHGTYDFAMMLPSGFNDGSIDMPAFISGLLVLAFGVTTAVMEYTAIQSIPSAGTEKTKLVPEAS